MTQQFGLEKQVVDRMTERGLTLSTAESTVGGLIGHLLTNVPGSSKVFVGGITAYHRPPKIEVMKADGDAIAKAGSVSEEAVRQMAHGVHGVMKTDVVVAESGVAGPTSDAERSGLYYIGIVADGYEKIARYQFPGGREETKDAAAQQALQLALDYLDQRSK